MKSRHLLLSLLSTPLFAMASSSMASASPVVGFDAGRIIDDVVMANSQSMNVTQIQSFLNSKVPICDNWGVNGSTSTSRRDYFISKSYPLPITCLKDYTENNKSSAQIIYDTAQEFSINPQVLIVLLQKEQGLVTDDWPDPTQYKSATGYGCPDTDVCDSQYYGFTNQLRNSAKMFQAILNNSPTWYTPYLLGNNYIQYSPNSNCGGSTVNIQNRATQALYNYTPYQPNVAALSSGYNNGDNCSAYGNRNFYLYFTDWFGSTFGYIQLDSPRWMFIKSDTRKIDAATKEELDWILTAGQQLEFTSKTKIYDQWYLRTKYDTVNNLEKIIPLSNIDELSYRAISTPTYKQLTSTAYKICPRLISPKNIQQLPSKTQIKLSEEISVNNNIFYRSEYDKNNNNDLAIDSSYFEDIPYSPMENPRYLVVNHDTYKVNPSNGLQDSTLISAGTLIKFNSKIIINGSLFLRADGDSNNNINLAVNINDLDELRFKSLDSAIWMKLSKDSNKIEPSTKENIDWLIAGGTQLKFYSYIELDNKTYYRTEYDTINNLNKVIDTSNLARIEYQNMENPRLMKIKTAVKKQKPSTGTVVDWLIDPDTQIMFTTKIQINNRWFLRTEYDTKNNNDKAIPIDALSEI
jgi:hypothetical protein